MKVFFIVVAVGLLLVGAFCTAVWLDNKYPQKVEPQPETPYSRCMRLGGIPATNPWNGALSNCIFPPKEK